VVPHIIGGNRDPKVAFHESSNQWVMALFLENNEYALFTSKDLKSWQEIQRIILKNASECPDFFEIPLDDDPTKVKWVLTGANGQFLAGSFDGMRFTPETGSFPSEWGKNYYAVQSYSDVKDGRRIQIGWMAGSEFRGMPFNQQMSFPRELSLRSTPAGIRLFGKPVREIEKLHGTKSSWTSLVVKSGAVLPGSLQDELYHMIATFNINKVTAKEFGLNLRGFEIRYNVHTGIIKAFRPSDKATSEVKVLPDRGRLQMEVLLDRASVEIFVNGGEVPMAFFYIPDDKDNRITLISDGGDAFLESFDVFTLKSIWE